MVYARPAEVAIPGRGQCVQKLFTLSPLKDLGHEATCFGCNRFGPAIGRGGTIEGRRVYLISVGAVILRMVSLLVIR